MIKVILKVLDNTSVIADVKIDKSVNAHLVQVFVYCAI